MLSVYAGFGSYFICKRNVPAFGAFQVTVLSSREVQTLLSLWRLEVSELDFGMQSTMPALESTWTEFAPLTGDTSGTSFVSSYCS